MKTRNLLYCTAAMATLFFAACKDKKTPEPDLVPPTDSTLSGEVSGTWTKNSTYHITGDILIPEGKTLTIEAGTTVIFDADAKPEVIVKGNLYCIGTAAAPVTFTVPDDKKQRPTTKGGSIWLEKTVRAELYNNLLANDRYGVKRDIGNPEDNRSVVSNTFYYGYSQEATDQFQPSDAIIAGTNDIISATAGSNDPKFVSYPLSTDMTNGIFNTSWDFHLQSNSPALNHGRTDFSPHFAASGITFSIGKTYNSPAPANYIGAFGTN